MSVLNEIQQRLHETAEEAVFEKKATSSAKKVMSSGPFQSWFKGSKIEPRVMFHGSMVPHLKRFDRTTIGKGVTGAGKGGFYFTSELENAIYYTNPTTYDSVPYELYDDDINVYGEEGEYYALVSYRDQNDPDEDGTAFNIGPYDTEEETERAASKIIAKNNEMFEKGETGPIHETSELDHVVTAILKMTNPFVVPEDAPKKITPNQAIQKAKQEGGYDGVVVKDTYDGATWSDVYVVFSADQIWVVNVV